MKVLLMITVYYLVTLKFALGESRMPIKSALSGGEEIQGRRSIPSGTCEGRCFRARGRNGPCSCSQYCSYGTCCGDLNEKCPEVKASCETRCGRKAFSGCGCDFKCWQRQDCCESFIAKCPSQYEKAVDDFVNNGGCFPSESKVKLEDGKLTTMSKLQIGDKVQTVSSSGTVMYSPVKALLKKQLNMVTENKLIKTANETLTLTGNHLVYTRKNVSDQFIPIYADQVSISDQILVLRNNKLAPVKMISTSKLTMQGAYVPLVMEGKIIADGVLASCYADFPHDLAHAMMVPMQRFADAMKYIFGEDTGFSTFVSTARELGFVLLPSGHFF